MKVESHIASASRLVQGCLRGDRAAMSQLYKQYAPALLAKCRSIVGNDDVAHDLLHDSFVVIYTSLGSLRDPMALEMWMMRIAERTSLQYLRHARQRLNAEQELTLDEQMHSTEVDAPVEPDYELISAMVDNLPEGYQRVFKLAVFDGLTHAEIGKLLGINPNSSSSQLWHAKQALRKSLKRYGLPVIALLTATMALLYTAKKSITPPSAPAPVVAHAPEHHNAATGDADKAGDMTEKTLNKPSFVCTGQSMSALPQHYTAPDVAHVMAPPQVEPALPDSGIVVAPARQSADTIVGVSVADNISHRELAKADMPRLVNKAKIPIWELALAYNGNVGSSSEMVTGRYEIVPQQTHAVDPDELVGQFSGVESNSNYSNYSGNFSDVIRNAVDRGYELTPENKYIEEQYHHELPLQLSLSAMKRVGERFSLGTGLTLTTLKSHFSITNSQVGENSHQKIVYIGVPLSIKYDWMKLSRFRFYSSAGAIVDFPVSARVVNETFAMQQLPVVTRQQIKVSPQFSLRVGVGAQWSITPRMSLFVEPAATYYFSNGTITHRSQHPFTLIVPTGLRLEW